MQQPTLHAAAVANIDDAPFADLRWHFGAFVLCETQRRLERDGHAVRVGPRSFDLLLHLVKRAGEYLSKEELLRTVWTGVVVEEGSVRVHMSTLRKALGEPADSDECKEWISNVPLRGYRFNGRVRHEVADSSARPARSSAPSFVKPPVRLTDLVGRDAEVQGVLTALDAHRLVTIAGTGGIGKTSVAIRAAEERQARHGTEIAFVDLSPLISQEHVPGTMARALGAAADLPDLVAAMSLRLAGRKVLLLIDNCEHVVEALTQPIASLLAALPDLHILATSREALRVTGEVVFRLSPLAVPNGDPGSLAQALDWPSVRLLVERARGAGAAAFDDTHASLLARISRQLDGIPLAIELVAARLGVQPVSDLVLRLDDHMRLSSNGSRSALARHRSLAAALDSSIALLDDEELRLFRRLSVFRGRFDAESALSVSVDVDPETAFDALISLVAKSLVFFDGSDAIAPYRLLDTTRSYAATLLAASGERPALLERHALFMLDLMKAATAELPSLTEQAWDDRYVHRLDDVRFALETCLTEHPGGATLAADLVTASGPLWFHVSQVAEYRDRIVATLALVEQQLEPDVETASSLNTVLISALLHSGGSIEALNRACDHALAGALATRCEALELRARWGRCTHDMSRGEYVAALQHSATLMTLAQSLADPGALILAHRVSAMANHFCGRLKVSRDHSGAAIALSGDVRLAHAALVGPDATVATQTLLCRTLWIQGEEQQALDVAAAAIARAQSLGHSVSLCAGLYGCCAVALWAGRLDLARQWVPKMSEEAKRSGLLGWLRYAQWFEQGLQLATAEDARPFVQEVAAQLPTCDAPHKEMLVTFCPDWLDDEVVARASRGQGLWCAAEAWRALGWRCERCGRLAEAETLYQRAVETAKQQGARGWERRAAASLARLQERVGDRH